MSTETVTSQATATPFSDWFNEEVVEEIAEALYEHWRSSSYELKRQPPYKDATPTLKRVFANQAKAVAPAIVARVEAKVAEVAASAETLTVFDDTEVDLSDEVSENTKSFDPEELHNSTWWAKELDITIMDADGWDRMNFDESWAELINHEEFLNRAFRSTMAANADLRKAGWDI
jgi:hypothetical protein